MIHQDQEISRKHGDHVVCGQHGKLSFVFRAGPVTKYTWMWSWCSCAETYRRGHQGRVKQCYGSYRRIRYYSTLKAEMGWLHEGGKIRKGTKFLASLAPKWDDENPRAHAEKNWKRHRKTQYLDRKSDKRADFVC